MFLVKQVARTVFEGAIQCVYEHSSGGQSKAPEIHALHTVEQGVSVIPIAIGGVVLNITSKWGRCEEGGKGSKDSFLLKALRLFPRFLPSVQALLWTVIDIWRERYISSLSYLYLSLFSTFFIFFYIPKYYIYYLIKVTLLICNYAHARTRVRSYIYIN